MKRTMLSNAIRVFGITALIWGLGQSCSWAGDLFGFDLDFGCFCCPKFHCPPPYKHCVEGSPNLCFKRGCPKPVCSPCTMPSWGYYQTCWTPWPWPADYSHCPVLPPASLVNPGRPPMDMVAPPVFPPTSPPELPAPRKMDRPPS